ncbi:dual specificity kinase [Raphidocelis subcapitata]|uniref:Dual specificity kinase n=1 Tax=Raphidocelis subcapitata TaxID=307507 RepID=A0A2V0NNA9_9CHLO|nr:dual specificity kinase [Raphidocelis subcapitata]|eukprot:GBF88689.1 dual specificity kinase [Raphidocelis subcapitata]
MHTYAPLPPRLTTKADVFAFGVLLYELLTRRLVTWNDDSAQAQAYERSVRGGRINVKRHGDESIQLLAYAERVADGYRPPIPDHWPEQAIALVEGCWAAEPSERPAMEAVQQTLAALMKDRRLLRQLEAEQPPAAPEGNTCACTIC